MNEEISTQCKDIYSFRLFATKHGASVARRLALRQLALWGLPYDTDVASSVGAVVAELAANAALHGRVPGRGFELSLERTEEVIRIEVSDTKTERRPPEPGALLPPQPDADSGRGLLIVQALSRAWGVSPRDVGKTVWAEVPTAGGDDAV